MVESKYLQKFQKVNSNPEIRKAVKIYGDKLLVELLPEEQKKTSGGIILPEDTNGLKTEASSFKARLAIVLMVGEGYYDDVTGEDAPLDTKPGDIVLLSDMGLRYYSTFPGIAEYTANGIAMTREGEVHMRFEGIEAYKAYEKALEVSGE